MSSKHVLFITTGALKRSSRAWDDCELGQEHVWNRIIVGTIVNWFFFLFLNITVWLIINNILEKHIATDAMKELISQSYR